MNANAVQNWRDEALRLRAKNPDMSQNEIARRCGVTQPAVSKFFNPDAAREYNRHDFSSPEGRARRRRWARSANGRGACVECGGQKGIGSGAKHDRCDGCHKAAQRRVVLERALEIERLWKDGRSLKEIAAHFDWSVNHVGVEIVRIRQNGWADLPYRHARPARQAA